MPHPDGPKMSPKNLGKPPPSLSPFASAAAQWNSPSLPAREAMMRLVRAMPGAMKVGFFKNLEKWDAEAVDAYAVSGEVTDSGVQLCGFFLTVWSDATGRAWEWKCPRFSLRNFVSRMDKEDCAILAAWVQSPFLP